MLSFLWYMSSYHLPRSSSNSKHVPFAYIGLLILHSLYSSPPLSFAFKYVALTYAIFQFSVCCIYLHPTLPTFSTSKYITSIYMNCHIIRTLIICYKGLLCQCLQIWILKPCSGISQRKLSILSFYFWMHSPFASECVTFICTPSASR